MSPARGSGVRSLLAGTVAATGRSRRRARIAA